MSIPELTRRSAEAKVLAFLERRIPPHVRDQIRLEHTVRGNAITIVERRPPWRADFGPEWSSRKIAQLRFDEKARTWTLWWPNRNERWLAYPDLGAAPDIDRLINEIDEDPISCFWG